MDSALETVTVSTAIVPRSSLHLSMDLSFWSRQATFETSSDRSFAQLLFKYEFSATALDAVLELLHDPSFTASELTFRCAADLYDRVVYCGRKHAEDMWLVLQLTNTKTEQ